MVQIAKHPKYEQGSANLKRRLEDRIDSDRHLAIVQLIDAHRMLKEFFENGDIAYRNDLLEEVSELMEIIRTVTPRRIHESAIGFLETIELRLTRLLGSLTELTTALGPVGVQNPH